METIPRHVLLNRKTELENILASKYSKAELNSTPGRVLDAPRPAEAVYDKYAEELEFINNVLKTPHDYLNIDNMTKSQLESALRNYMQVLGTVAENSPLAWHYNTLSRKVMSAKDEFDTSDMKSALRDIFNPSQSRSYKAGQYRGDLSTRDLADALDESVNGAPKIIPYKAPVYHGDLSTHGMSEALDDLDEDLHPYRKYDEDEIQERTDSLCLNKNDSNGESISHLTRNVVIIKQGSYNYCYTIQEIKEAYKMLEFADGSQKGCLVLPYTHNVVLFPDMMKTDFDRNYAAHVYRLSSPARAVPLKNDSRQIHLLVLVGTSANAMKKL